MGGSPLTTAANIIAEQGLIDKTVMVGGMNLPMVLSAVLTKDDMDSKELIDALLPEAREALKEFYVAEEKADDEI